MERRGAERVALSGKRVRIRISDSHGVRTREGNLREISCTGASIIAELPELPAGAEVSLELSVPTWLYLRRLRIPATLVRSEDDDGRHELAFALDQSSSSYRRLRRYVTQAAKAKAAVLDDWGRSQRVAEALRMAQAGLLPKSAGGPRVIVVTSAVQSEGKELVASGLTALLAQEGEDVLIVDADLGNPSLHVVFDVPARPGVSEWLTSSRTGDRGARPSIADLTKRAACGIAVLAAGRATDLRTETSSRELVEALRPLDFGFVIINAPPILLAAGAGVLAGASDDVLLVARSAVSLERQLVEACKALERHQSNVRGVVLTDHADVLGGAPGGTWLGRWSGGKAERMPDDSGKAHKDGPGTSEMLDGGGALRVSEDES